MIAQRLKAPMLMSLMGAATFGFAACAPLPEDEPIMNGPPSESVCHADRYQYLVGRNRSEIPQTPAGASWRVACTTCPVTMDYRGDRMNIFYNERTGIIEQVRCG